MHIEIIYAPARRGFDRRQMLRIWRWPFLGLAFACAVVNLAVGGKAWSLVAIWGLYMVWSNLFALNMVDYNRMSQGVKMTLQILLELLLIDLLLAPGWALFVVPIVAFGAMIALGALFFSDFRRQKANVMALLAPALPLGILGAVGSWIWKLWSWPMVVFCAVTLGLSLACIAALGSRLPASLKKYFHLK